ncbi:MAG: type II toxin-antitoxin system RelE/ParE family toxin [Novosphingobium sp.]
MADPIEIRETADYGRCFAGLKDVRGRARIDARLRRLSLGHFGDAKALGGGISELRIDCGPGYRIYLTRHAAAVVILLAGGDKSRQSADIVRDRSLAAQLE